MDKLRQSEAKKPTNRPDQRMTQIKHNLLNTASSPTTTTATTRSRNDSKTSTLPKNPIQKSSNVSELFRFRKIIIKISIFLIVDSQERLILKFFYIKLHS